MLKITILPTPRAEVVLKLEGRVVGPWVQELAGSCERLLGDGAPIVVDLGEVAFIDWAGVALLRRLRERGVAFRNCSQFVSEQLREVAPC
jgi:anti-anti-sigma regulatory factor